MESITAKSTFFCLIASVLYATFATAGANAQEGTLEVRYRGVSYVAVPARTGNYYKGNIVNTRQAVEKMRMVVDLFEKKSTFNATALERLKKNGDVRVIVDPDAITVMAAFWFDRKTEQATGRKQFPIFIGRYSIHEELEYIVPMLAHELVGHGIQHLNARLQSVDRKDSECEAHLYQERYYQDAGVDKRSLRVVAFRRTLHEHYCVPFRQYIRTNMPSKVELWYTLNPDVPQLLSIFDKYLRTKYGL